MSPTQQVFTDGEEIQTPHPSSLSSCRSVRGGARQPVSWVLSFAIPSAVLFRVADGRQNGSLRRLDGEAACRSSSALDAQPASPPTGAGGSIWTGGNRSLPDRDGGGKSRGSGQFARGCDGRRVPSLLPDLAGGRRAQSPKDEEGMGIGERNGG